MNALQQSQMQLLRRLKQHAVLQPDALAYVDVHSSESLTWRQLFRRTAGLARRILQSLPLPGGAVVPIRIANHCHFSVAFLGTLAAGKTAFPLSPESPPAEAIDIALQTSSLMMIGQEIQAFPGGCITPDQLGIESDDLPDITFKPDDTGLMLLSSGSTAAPKIVCRSFGSLDIVCDQMCQAIGITAADRVLATVPLCHSYGIEHGLLAPVWAGAAVHLGRGLDLPVVQRELLRSGITLLPAVPSMYEMLANLASPGEHFPALRAAYSAGAPLPASVADRFFDRCGVRIGQVFGATEIGSVTYSNPNHPHFNPHSVGQPMPGVKIRIDDEDLSISAGSIFTGYLHEDASQIIDGFYPTGDLAKFDEHGNLIITGRSKLLIDIGGLKVNPLEVEAILTQHPAINECVVIPVRQSETVMRLKAILTLRNPQRSISTEELRKYARERMSGYKVPRIFEIRPQLPHSPTGKILRHQIDEPTA